jgi:signal transduction histidine kinase
LPQRRRRSGCAPGEPAAASAAGAADRLGRGEGFDPLPESGPNETRQANIAFNRMRERLERFIRDRTAMLAAIAHDLRTPITSLRLRAEFIDDDEIKSKILETLAEMQAMAEAVLAFARGDAEAEPTRLTDLTALVDSIVEDAAASGRDIRFEDSPPVTLACRPFALRRAIGNLLDNAASYGGGARARIEAGPDEIRILIDDDGPASPYPSWSAYSSRSCASRVPGAAKRRRRARPRHCPDDSQGARWRRAP